MPSRRPCSAPFAHDSGCCKRPHFAYAIRLQYPRARFERCAGRRDVVDENRNAGIRDQGSGIRAEGERILHILLSPMLRQFNLRLREDDALQKRRYRQAELPSEIISLIESALVLPARMQRHRHHDGRIAKQFGAAFLHQRAKRRSDRATALVFQRVDDVFHASFVAIDRARPLDRVIARMAFAEMRREANARPALLAHRAVERMQQTLLAGRTRRL